MDNERNEKQMSVMDFFGFDQTEVEDAIKQKEEELAKARDGRICACGHPVRHHNVETGTQHVSCKPGRQLCPCTLLKPVIKVADTRYFMRRSEGNGRLHALSMGIVASIKANKDLADKMEWLVPNTCEKCGTEDVQLFPTHVTADGVIMDEPTRFNALLCDNCRFG